MILVVLIPKLANKGAAQRCKLRNQDTSEPLPNRCSRQSGHAGYHDAGVRLEGLRCPEIDDETK
jgi:hypothetical protein